jgi:DNA-binding protein YbaB
MAVDHEQLIEQLTEEYEKARARTVELRRKISELTASATAPRETVKVTVGAQGDVRSVDFPTGAYKRMAPAELSAALMAAISEAKDKAQGMLNELMAPAMPAGLDFLELMRGEAELPDMDGSELNGWRRSR